MNTMQKRRWIAIAGLTILATVGLWWAIGPESAANAKSRPSASAPSNRQADGPIHFVQISDSHLGANKAYQTAERLVAVVKAVNALPMPIALVAITGDVFSDTIEDPAIVSQAQSILGKLNAPLHVVPGNHDIVPGPRQAAMAKRWKQLFGPTSHAVEVKGLVFLFVYTESLSTKTANPAAANDDPLTWLKTQLEAAGDKPVILLHHQPSVTDFYSNQMHPGWPEASRKKWNALVQRPNVQAVLAGHFHRDEFHWLGKTPLYVSASVIGEWGRQPTFRIYTYQNGKLSYRTQYIEPKQILPLTPIPARVKPAA